MYQHNHVSGATEAAPAVEWSSLPRINAYVLGYHATQAPDKVASCILCLSIK